MNSSIVSLLKVSLKQTFDFRNKKKNQNTSLMTLIILILVFGSIFVGIYAVFFALLLKEANKTLDVGNILFAMAGVGSMLAMVTSITKVKNTLFGGNDYDMLASLPVKKSHIIFVKFISVYLEEMLYSFIFTIPTTIVVLGFGASLIYLLYGLLIFFMMPIIPLLLSALIGTFISFISDRFKFGNFLTILFYFVFLGFIMYLSMMMNSADQNLDGIVSLIENVAWLNPTTALLKLNLLGLNVLIYLTSNLITLVLTILLLAKCYDYFHVLLTSTDSHHKYVEKDVKPNGQFKGMFLLDLKRYFRSKTYLMNTITGGILTVIMSIVMIFSFKSAGEGSENILKEAVPYFSLFIIWCIGISVPSACAINFEGKNFWLVKTMPISYKQYAFSKVLLSEVVLAPFVLVTSCIYIWFAEKDFMVIFSIITLPQLYLLGISLLGVYVNSIYYKLNWSNEMEAVKNSKATVIGMLADFACTIVLCAVMLGVGLTTKFIYGAIAAIIIVLGFVLILVQKVSHSIAYNISNIEM